MSRAGQSSTPVADLEVRSLEELLDDLVPEEEHWVGLGYGSGLEPGPGYRRERCRFYRFSDGLLASAHGVTFSPNDLGHWGGIELVCLHESEAGGAPFARGRTSAIYVMRRDTLTIYAGSTWRT